jgi:hypothetical protein
MKKDHLDGNKVNEIPIKFLFCAVFFSVLGFVFINGNHKKTFEKT